MTKKFLLIFTLFAILFSSGIKNADAAASSFDCSNLDQRCVGIKFTSFGTPSAISNSIYLPYGVKVFVDGQTYDSSMFSMSFYVIDSTGKVVSPIVGVPPFGSGDYEIYSNQKAGYYRIKGICGDSSTQERCTGQGMFYYQYQ